MTEYSTIQKEVDRISENISDAYDVAEGLGATLPQTLTSNNLASTLNTINAITVDDELSVTSENPVQNKVLYPSLSGFIPANTVITVELDGSGDFTNLDDAVNYLTGKWSNGAVTIKLGAGTHEIAINTTITINALNFNFTQLIIKGDSRTTTIIHQSSTTVKYVGILEVINWGTPVCFQNLTISGTSSNSIGIGFMQSQGVVSNISVQNVQSGLMSYGNTKVRVENFYGTGLSYGIVAQGGQINMRQTTITLNNVNTAIWSVQAGFIQGSQVTKNYTGVTTQSSPSINTLSGDGLILWA